MNYAVPLQGRAFWATQFSRWAPVPEQMQADTIKKIRERRGLPPVPPKPEEYFERKNNRSTFFFLIFFVIKKFLKHKSISSATCGGLKRENQIYIDLSYCS